MSNLSFREANESDSEAQLQYFENSTDEFLRGLGVDPKVIRSKPRPNSDRLKANLKLPNAERSHYSLAMENDGQVFGIVHFHNHEFGKLGELHVHIFNLENRHRGYASKLFSEVVPHIYDIYRPEILFCTPSASNIPINKFLQKQGLEIVSSYTTPAAGILLERLANRYEMSPEFIEGLRKRSK